MLGTSLRGCRECAPPTVGGLGGGPTYWPNCLSPLAVLPLDPRSSWSLQSGRETGNPFDGKVTFTLTSQLGHSVKTEIAQETCLRETEDLVLFVQSASVCSVLVAEPPLHDRRTWAQAGAACGDMMPRVPEALGEGLMLRGGRPGADEMKPALPQELQAARWRRHGLRSL